jgi:putative solute:sodium symporter small subunit
MQKGGIIMNTTINMKERNEKERITKKFWEKNLRLITASMIIWFVSSYGIVILLGDVLAEVKFLGCNLSFWFGQQGSILVFFLLVLNYALQMDRITRSLKKEYDGGNTIEINEKGA